MRMTPARSSRNKRREEKDREGEGERGRNREIRRIENKKRRRDRKKRRRKEEKEESRKKGKEEEEGKKKSKERGKNRGGREKGEEGKREEERKKERKIREREEKIEKGEEKKEKKIKRREISRKRGGKKKVNLRGLLELGKRDLSLFEYLDQLGSFGIYSFVSELKKERVPLARPGVLIRDQLRRKSKYGVKKTHIVSRAIFFLSAAAYFAPDSFLPCLVRADSDVVLGLPNSLQKGAWFSFAKRHAPAIPDYMSWRHPRSAIDDPRPAVGSFNIVDVRRLSAHVVKLRVLVLSGLRRVWKSRTFMGTHDFLCLLDWTGAEVQREPHHDIKPTLQRLPFYCTPLAAADASISDPTPKDLAASNPSAKVVAKAEASQKRNVSTFGAALSHVAKRTRSAMAHSSGSIIGPNIFADDSGAESDDDDDACFEIPLVNLIYFAVVIPSSWNQGGGSTALAAEGPSTRDSRGKGVMTDAAVASPVGAIRPRPSFGLAFSFRDISRYVIHRDFFPFSPSPYYATYPEGGVAGNCEFTREEWDAPHQPTLSILTKEVFKDPSICKTVVDQFPTPREMVRIEALSSDQLTTKMSVLYCLMMLHGGELLAWYCGLLQSYHEYVAGLNDKLSSSDAAFARSKSKGNERKKKIKSLTKSLDNMHAEVARLFADSNRATVLEAEKDEEILRLKATPPEFGELFSLGASAGFERGLSMHRTKEEFAAISEHADKPLSVILQLDPEKLARSANVLALRDARVSPPVLKESTVTPAFASLELPSNTVPTSFVAVLEPNEEWANTMVDGPDHEMTVRAADANLGNVFVQGASHAIDDDAELTLIGSERVSSSPNDVVVALYVGGKGDGSLPSSTVDKKVAATPSRV
ncbi:hypothetical protein Tco_0034063 [Tanacetum coccineum]